MSNDQQFTTDQSLTMYGNASMHTDQKVHTEPTRTSHPTATIVLHWSTVVAIVIAVAAIYFRDMTEDRMLRQVLLNVHRQLGLLVMMCVVLRLIVRYVLGFANHTHGMETLLRWLARMMHWVLYAFLIALPLLGLAATGAKGISLRLFYLIPLPGLVAADPDMADTLLDYHMWAAWVLFGLVAIHAIAALWHHFVLRDGVLHAMLPKRRQVAPQRRHALFPASPAGHDRRRINVPVAHERRRSPYSYTLSQPVASEVDARTLTGSQHT